MKIQALVLLLLGPVSWNASRSCAAQDIYFPGVYED